MAGLDLTSSGSPVRSVRRGAVLVLGLARPEVRNAIDRPMARALVAAIDRLERSDDLRAAVLTGLGGTFCAGMDLRALAAGERPWEVPGFQRLVRRGAVKPLVAAIEGVALAGGFELALACDLLVAARGASLAIPEARLGLVAAGGALLRLPRRIPYHVAMELALTGGAIDAERAARLGLVNRLAPPGEALGHALELAAAVA